jgi:hypothetical protein
MSTARRQKPARKKNKLDEIMATGVETGSALEECAHGEALVSRYAVRERSYQAHY